MSILTRNTTFNQSSLEIRICVSIFAKYYADACAFCDTFKLKRPVSGAKNVFSFNVKQLSVNLATFYSNSFFFYSCTHCICSSSEMQCPVSGAKNLK